MKTKPKDRCDVWAVDEEKVTGTKKRLPSDETFTAVSETFGALADSNRAKILCALEGQELCVCDIACVVGISESAISQHLRILRTLHLVKNRKDGRMMYYSLSDSRIHELLQLCLEHTKRV